MTHPKNTSISKPQNSKPFFNSKKAGNFLSSTRATEPPFFSKSRIQAQLQDDPQKEEEQKSNDSEFVLSDDVGKYGVNQFNDVQKLNDKLFQIKFISVAEHLDTEALLLDLEEEGDSVDLDSADHKTEDILIDKAQLATLINAVERFQMYNFNWSKYDGTVEVGGLTHKKLEEIKTPAEMEMISKAYMDREKLITRSVGLNGENRSEDVFNVLYKLHELGVISFLQMYDLSGIYDGTFIMKYQNRIFSDPKDVDGTIVPGKGTEAGLLKNRKGDASKDVKAEEKKDALDYEALAQAFYDNTIALNWWEENPTNEEEVYRLLEKLENDDAKIEKFKNTYEKKFDRKLVKDIKSEFSNTLIWGDELNRVLALLNMPIEGSEKEEESTNDEESNDNGCQLIEYQSSRFINKKVIIDRQFKPSIEKIEKLLEKYDLILYINDSARKHGASVKGAIVTPAKTSNHLAGHAIDMNIKYKGALLNSSKVKNENFPNLPKDVQNFISDIRSDPNLRWGGDFNDPVHIDDGLNIRDFASWEKRFKIIQEELLDGECPE